MKNKKQFFIPFLLALFISAFFAGRNFKPAFAQDQCLDAAGGVIPCPPGKDNSGGGDGGNQNHPPSVPATATSTPLSITNPTDENESAGSEWSGTCKLTDKKCPLVFSNGCKHVGGTWKVESTTETEVTLKCTVPLHIEPTPPPLSSNPTATSLAIVDSQKESTEGGWTGRCSKYNTSKTHTMADCINNFKTDCRIDKGTVTETTKDGVVDILCKTTDGRPNGGFPDLFPWLGGGLVGILVGLLLPAIQKVRDAAARSRSSSARLPNNKNPELVKNQDDQDDEYMKKSKRSEAE